MTKHYSLITLIATVLALLCILFIAFWIRIQGIERIPQGQFTANDAYLYYHNAKQITEHGYLPAIDKHRWLPHGRDERQTLHFYAYALVYTQNHKYVLLRGIPL